MKKTTVCIFLFAFLSSFSQKKETKIVGKDTITTIYIGEQNIKPKLICKKN